MTKGLSTGNGDSSPLVTVVMPAYNAESWISEAIESVLRQSIASWELFVVDDCSSDNTQQEVQKFRDPRISLLSDEKSSQNNHNKKNKGASYARNIGINAARGKYIALLDADDWYESCHLELTTMFLEQHPDCSLVTTNYFFVRGDGGRELGMLPFEVLGRAGNGMIDDFFNFPKRNRTFPITCGAVFRRELVPHLGAFDEAFRIAEDMEFWIRWALKSSFGYIDEPTCCYRVDTQGSNRKNLELSIRMRCKVWQKLTAAEDKSNPQWPTYAKFRSLCLFRLTAKLVATGFFDEARLLSSTWPQSPSHFYWWLGKSLALMPRMLQKTVHATIGKMDFVKHRFS
ncbi:glycosyltransferase [bacterium]|nr:glycosyltransferase [bacterium]